MDKVLKRRLIGASILIALAVIFVPMLLVDPDSVRDGGENSVDVPSMPDSAREVRRIPLDPEAARTVQPDRQPSGRSSDSPASRDASGDRADAEPQRAAPDDEIVLRPDLNESRRTSDASDSTAASRASTETPAQPEIEPESQPEAQSQASQSEPQPEPAVAAPEGDRAADEAGTGDWVVQVASFGSRESSDQVRERLEALGHNVTRDEIVRGQSLLHRLRTGPYPDRAAAQQALEQIAATVSGVEPIVRRFDEQMRQGTQSGFAVQVGSFVSEDNAQGETRRLDELGFEAFRFSEQVGERVIWRVMVGPVAERDAADELRSRLAERAGLEGLVVSYP